MVIFSVDNNIVLNVVNDYVSAVFSVTDHKCCLREVIQKHASHALSGATIIFAPPPQTFATDRNGKVSRQG